MNGTLIIVGGYWRASKYLLTQVDAGNDVRDRGVDYVVRFKNLPDKFLEVESIPKKKYHCTVCNSPVPEWEVENRTGCYVNHKLQEKIEYIKNYQAGLIDVVPDELGDKKKMIKGAIRVHLSNPRGMEILTKIFDYVKRSYGPGETVPSPLAVGTLTGWLIDSVDDIPTWELPELEKKDESTAPKDQRQCPHCDVMVKDDDRAIRMHIMKKHPEIFALKYEKKDKEKV